MMNIYGITREKLAEYFSQKGENSAKADIVFDGIYRRKVTDFRALGLSQRVSDMLCRDFSFDMPEVCERLESDDAAKLLLKLSDGEFVETVLMRQKFGSFVCVSTQVGCSMGCAFCRSGQLKKRRNLSADEIVGQILTIEREFAVKVNGVSVMGIGEPFDNFDALCDVCGIITAGKGLALGQRHVTVSTCGVVPRIYDFAEQPHPCNLAISLHAPNDELRNKLMPINKAYPLSELMKAAECFSAKTNTRVALEYVMLNGINDTPEHARQLSELISGRNFYVNIIPYNETDGGFCKSPHERIMAFYDVLKKHGVGVTMRREFGGQLKAACGQLRSDYTDKMNGSAD